MPNPFTEDEPLAFDSMGVPRYVHQLSPLEQAATTIGARINTGVREAMTRMLQANDRDES